jgi:DNA helicase-2/ATP-dependent DNA helicase PcrA
VARDFVIWDRDDSLRTLKKITKDLGQGDNAPRSFLAGISRRKGEGIGATIFAESTSSHRDKVLAEVWLLYEKALSEEDALDFDDLLLRTLRLLQTSPEVLKKLQNRWSYITIDEYQDTNLAQYEIRASWPEKREISAWSANIDQNIYSWRGADIEHLLNFEVAFPGAKVILLEQNYRSTRTILAAANAIIAKNVRRKEKTFLPKMRQGNQFILRVPATSLRGVASGGANTGTSRKRH